MKNPTSQKPIYDGEVKMKLDFQGGAVVGFKGQCPNCGNELKTEANKNLVACKCIKIWKIVVDELIRKNDPKLS